MIIAWLVKNLQERKVGGQQKLDIKQGQSVTIWASLSILFWIFTCIWNKFDLRKYDAQELVSNLS